MISTLCLIAHWLELLGLAYFIGALFCGLFIVPGHALKVERSLFDKMWKYCTYALIIMLAGHFADFYCIVYDIDADIGIIMLKTHFGPVCLIRLIAMISLLLMWIFGRNYRDNNRFLYLCLAVSLLISYTMSVVGHPSGWGNFGLAVWVNWFHVLSACVWGGGLLVLTTAILPEIQRGQFNTQLFVAIAFAFSRIALTAVVIIGATATYSSLTYIGNFEKIFYTSYGWTILFKTVLFFILMGIGAFNKFYLLPLANSRNNDSKVVCQSLKHVVNIECVLIIVVFLASALLHQQIPASHYHQPTHIDVMQSQSETEAS